MRRQKVTVSFAFTAAPRTLPLAPSMPLGRSTAITLAPDRLIASTAARAAPFRSRAKPPPNSASTITRASFNASAENGSMVSPQRLRRLRRVAFQRRARAEQERPHRDAPLAQAARRDEAVPAIVAGPADDHDLGPERQARGDHVGDRPPRALHELDRRRPGRNRAPVGFGHFRGSDEFMHRLEFIARPSHRVPAAYSHPFRRPKGCLASLRASMHKRWARGRTGGVGRPLPFL